MTAFVSFNLHENGGEWAGHSGLIIHGGRFHTRSTLAARARRLNRRPRPRLAITRYPAGAEEAGIRVLFSRYNSRINMF